MALLQRRIHSSVGHCAATLQAHGIGLEEMATRPYGANATAGKRGHTYQSVFNQKVLCGTVRYCRGTVEC